MARLPRLVPSVVEASISEEPRGVKGKGRDVVEDVLDWAYLDLDAEPGELYLSNKIQKGNPDASYLDLADETRRQLHRWIIVLFAGLSLVFTLLQLVL